MGTSANAARPDVSVVIVSWNTRDDLRRCLASLRREAGDVSLETFVVDNASRDGSAGMVREEFPEACVVANAENRGFAAANNQALRRARGRYALLLNPDTSVLDGAVARSVAIADADPSVAVLGCQVLVREGAIQPTCFRCSSAFHQFLINTGLDRALPASWFGGGPALRGWDRRSARDVEVVSGMYMLVRLDAIAQVGLMDEDYFVYAEEADWCLRFRRAGWRCRFDPAARIVHHDGGGRSTSQARARMWVQLQKSVLVFHRKHLGPASWWAVKAIYLAGNTVRAAAWTLVRPLDPSGAARDKARCATAALAFHLAGVEPRDE